MRLRRPFSSRFPGLADHDSMRCGSELIKRAMAQQMPRIAWHAHSRVAYTPAAARLPRSLVPLRSLTTTPPRGHGGITRPAPGTGIKVTFRDSQGKDIKTVEANDGDDILSIAHEYDIDLEGACEGSIACSTCHVILEEDVFDQLEEPCDDENDMLDLAFGLTDTSRLGCQVHVTRNLDGLVVQLPSATRNMYVDGARGGN